MKGNRRVVRARDHGKRILDVLLAGTLLVVFAPVLGLTALVVRIRFGRPVLFVQARTGLYGCPFHLVKFRTMLSPAQAGGRTDDGARLTRLGRALRATSVDELPTLWNVLRGDMSLVGPRPLPVEYLPLYEPRHLARQEVRPGITGLAQVSGRNELEWGERLDKDVEYVRRRGVGLDLWILARTVSTVLSRRGIRQPGSVTSERLQRGYMRPPDV